MGKNDFDIDFDFEKEYGFDPKAFLGTEDYDDHIDLTAFTDEELGLKPQAEPVDEDVSDFDLDADLEEFLSMAEEEAEEAEDVFEDEEEDESYVLPEENYAEAPAEEEASDEELQAEEAPSFEDEDLLPDEEAVTEDVEYSQEEDVIDQSVFEDQPAYVFEEDEEEEDEEESEDQTASKRPRKEFKMPKIVLPKIKTPNVFTKFYDLYFAPVMNKELREEPPVGPTNSRRRRKKSKAQIFKEVYLPPIIVCVTLILVLSFCIGALSNAIAQRQDEKQKEQSQLAASQDAEALKEQEYQRIMAEAEELAAGYNYKDAIGMLDSFGDMTDYPEMSTKRAEYVNAQNQLVPHGDPSLIPNLSFHVLIEDLPRAMADDDDLAGSYNRNFVSTGEFKAILNQLYANGYVLVDFGSITDVQDKVDGTKQYMAQPVYLPADKKPIMITETMANYYGYMIDSNDDGVADAGGDGFASKLVVQNGEIKAEYVDKDGNTLIGDYDLIPILETFIKEHPDFSYQGARATVAVTGYEGVFGYRTNTSYVASVSQAYYDEQVAGAKEVVNALKEKGYNIACFTYSNKDYGNMSATQITADLTEWTKQITPVVGEVDTLIFAREGNIPDYNGNLFNVLYKSGFRYFVSKGTKPWAEVNSNYVRQNRLMVTGNAMQWNTSWFTGIFDCASVLDVNTRGNVPN